VSAALVICFYYRTAAPGRAAGICARYRGIADVKAGLQPSDMAKAPLFGETKRAIIAMLKAQKHI